MDFVEADVYAAPEALGTGKWDVFTGIGALGWLPDIKRWAKTVAALLKPSGELFIREGHPVLFTIGEEDRERLVVEYPYFETEEPIVSDVPSTYVRLEMEGKKFESRKTVEWNHGLGEIVSAVLEVGMRVTMLVEHKSVPWNALPGMMVDVGGGEFAFLYLGAFAHSNPLVIGEWALKEDRDRMPLSYTLRAVKE